MYNLSEHVSHVTSFKIKLALTTAQFVFLQDLMSKILKPTHVVGGNDRRTDVASQVAHVLFSGKEGDSTAFTFGVVRDDIKPSWLPGYCLCISDTVRTFHLLALFVTSQPQQENYLALLEALQDVFIIVCGKMMKV
ncbi:Hypothetical protein PHPALM_20835 [Phytophthora palmivora]|uniref:MULE transposase domain-containing protein n=1 Tax=Phytophthora palmivora TaxID=4796 RepID=A0A2P4XDV1_9STRA|nr:Hypothetical protein PHPALM_20835 [Phytophthora palmivora]